MRSFVKCIILTLGLLFLSTNLVSASAGCKARQRCGQRDVNGNCVDPGGVPLYMACSTTEAACRVDDCEGSWNLCALESCWQESPVTPTPTPPPYCRSDSLCDSTVSDFTCNAGSCKPWERRTGIVKRYQYDPAASSCTTTPCDNVSDICTSDCRCNDSCPTSTPTPTATSTPACFLSGTQISTPRGDKPIETLTAGDRVWSFDEQTGKVVANEVEELVTSQTDAYYIIETASGRQIKATGDHPVYTGRQLSLRESLWTRIRGLFWKEIFL